VRAGALALLRFVAAVPAGFPAAPPAAIVFSADVRVDVGALDLDWRG